MKFFHISDLHLGKRVNEFLMLDDQKHILMEIVRFAKIEKPDAVLIAGDVYDKSVPSVEAVQLLDNFLVSLHELGIAIFMIAGNHDSVERISFASELLSKNNVHISSVYDGGVKPITLSDSYGRLDVWLLPYLKPSGMRKYYDDKKINSYSQALAFVLDSMEVNKTSRNVLVTHQFVTGAETSESEEAYIGNLENVDAALFDPFDYVALGHIHRPQKIKRETLRYAGSPLKYSISEKNHQKSITVVEMKNKGDVAVREIPLTPIREIREVRGTYNEITNRSNYLHTNTNDYIHVILTDEQDEPDAIMKLRCIYPNLMKLDYDNKRTRATAFVEAAVGLDKKKPFDFVNELYFAQNGQPMDSNQSEYIHMVLGQLQEEEHETY